MTGDWFGKAIDRAARRIDWALRLSVVAVILAAAAIVLRFVPIAADDDASGCVMRCGVTVASEGGAP